MNNKKMSSGQITGVGCDVTNCKYNTIDLQVLGIADQGSE